MRNNINFVMGFLEETIPLEYATITYIVLEGRVKPPGSWGSIEHVLDGYIITTIATEKVVRQLKDWYIQ